MNDNGILTVKKQIVYEEYEQPAITFTVTADCDDPVWFRLIESIPATEDDVEIGFHPDNGHEQWEMQDGTLVYEDVIWEEKNAFTLYGIATRDRDVIQTYLTEPMVEVAQTSLVERPDSGDWVRLDDDQLDIQIAERIATDGGKTGDSIHKGVEIDRTLTEMHAGLNEVGLPSFGEVSDDRSTEDEDRRGIEAQSVPATGRTDNAGRNTHRSNGASAGDEVPRDYGNSQSDENGGDGSVRGGTSGGKDSIEDPDNSAVIEELAVELREGNASDEAVGTLRRHLTPDTPASDVAKLDHCLTRIGELEAYVDALEEFLDEDGTAQTLLKDLRQEIGAVEERLDEFDDRLGVLQDQQTSFEDRLAEVESEAEGVDDLREQLTATRAEFADFDAELREIRTDLDHVEEWRSSVITALSAAESNAQAMRNADQN